MPWSRGKKILVGCLVAVAAVVLLFIAAVVVFVSWLSTPGEELAARSLITPDTAFYFRLRLPEEDPGVRELIRVWARSQNRLDQNADMEQMPPIFRRLLPVFSQMGQREVPDEELDKMLPMQLVVTAPRMTDGEPPLLFVVNAPGLGNGLRLADWILGRVGSGEGDLQSRSHGDERLFRIGRDQPAWVCIAGTDILVSTDPDTLAATLDWMAPAPDAADAATGGSIPPDLAEALLPLPPEAPLQVAGIAGVTAPLTDVLLARPAPALARILRPHLEGARSLTGWARLEGTDRLVGRLLIGGAEPSPEDSTVWTLEFLDGRVSLRVADAGMNVTGQRVLDLELSGMEALVEWGAGRLSGIRVGR